MSKPRNRRDVMAGGFGLAIGGMMAVLPSAAQGWTGSKVLVVYYSRTGHTRTVAEMISRRTGGNLIEIETVEPYPEDYDALVAQNVDEQQSAFLPALTTRIDNIGDYDIVFVGSPIWNVRLTPPVRSLLSSYDLAGTRVAPFVTYIVSGLGRCREDIAEIAPDARILDGLAVLGDEAAQAEGTVADWLAAVENQIGE
jgi:flavodoxin